MAKQMAYSCPITGKQYSQSYWHVAEVNLNKHAETGKIRFHGYANAADRAIASNKLSSAAALIIGSKEYFISKDDYAQYFSDTRLKAAGVNSYTQSYALADTTHDTVTNETSTSFFENAVNV